MRSDRASIHTYLETAFAGGLGKLDVTMPGASDGHAFFTRFDADVEIIAARAGRSSPGLVFPWAELNWPTIPPRTPPENRST
ncbi:hypothetical protein [Glaciihabitans sp. UYNi722]|uniref:hypothetical protein n=1 Tax=Glaciihabitans sp. UYNi722 TaxID=3156344 RepID=UPI0033961B05